MYNFDEMCCCSHRCCNCSLCCRRQMLTNKSNSYVCRNFPSGLNKKSTKIMHNATTLNNFEEDDVRSSVASRLGQCECSSAASNNRVDDRSYKGEETTSANGSGLLTPVGSVEASIQSKGSMSSESAPVPAQVSPGYASVSNKSSTKSSTMTLPRESMDGSRRRSGPSKSPGENQRDSKSETTSKLISPMGSITASIKSKASVMSNPPQEGPQSSADRTSGSAKSHTNSSKLTTPMGSIDASLKKRVSGSPKSLREYRSGSQKEAESREGGKLSTPTGSIAGSPKSKASGSPKLRGELAQESSGSKKSSTDSSKMSLPLESVGGSPKSKASASPKSSRRASRTEDASRDDSKLSMPIDYTRESTKSRVSATSQSPREASRVSSARSSRSTASSKKGAQLQMVDQTNRKQQDDFKMGSPVRQSLSSPTESSPRLSNEHSQKSKLFKTAATVKNKIGEMAKKLTTTLECPPCCPVDYNYLKKLIAPLEKEERNQKPTKVTPKMKPTKSEKVLEKIKPKRKSKKLVKRKSQPSEAQSPQTVSEPKVEQSPFNDIWFDCNVPIRVSIPTTVCYGSIWDLLPNTLMNSRNSFSIMDNKTETLLDPDNNALARAGTPPSPAEPSCKLCITMRPMGCGPPMLARVPVAMPAPAEPAQPQCLDVISRESKVVQAPSPAEPVQQQALEKVTTKRKVVKRKIIPSQLKMCKMCSQRQTTPNNSISQDSCDNSICQYSMCSDNLSGNRTPPNSARTLASKKMGYNLDVSTGSRENKTNDAFNRKQLYENRSQFQNIASTPLSQWSKEIIRYRTPPNSKISLQREVTKRTTSKTLSWNTNAHKPFKHETFYFNDSPISECYLENSQSPISNNVSQLSSHLMEQKQNTCNYGDFQDLGQESQAKALANIRVKCDHSTMARLPPLRNFLPSVQGRCNNSMATMESYVDTDGQSMQNSMYDYSTFDGMEMESAQSEFVCNCRSCQRAYQDSNSDQTTAASLYSEVPKTFSNKSTYVRACIQNDVAPSGVHQKLSNTNRPQAELKSTYSLEMQCEKTSKDTDSQGKPIEADALQDLLSSIQVPVLDDEQIQAPMPQDVSNKNQNDSNIRTDRDDAQKSNETDEISIKRSKTDRTGLPTPSTYQISKDSLQAANKSSEGSRKQLAELANNKNSNCGSRLSITQSILELIMEANKRRFSGSNVAKTIASLSATDTYSVNEGKYSSPQIQDLASEKNLNKSINSDQDCTFDQAANQCTKATCARYLRDKESNTESRTKSYACGPINDKLRRRNLKLCLLKQDHSRFLPTLEEYKVTAYTRVSKKYSFQKGGSECDSNGNLKLHPLNETNMAKVLEELKKCCHRVPTNGKGRAKLPVVLMPFRQKGNGYGTMITICQPDEWRELEVSLPIIPGNRSACYKSVCSNCRLRTGPSRPAEASFDSPKRSINTKIVAGVNSNRHKAETKAFVRENSNRPQSPKTEPYREQNRAEYKKATKSNPVPYHKREVRDTHIPETSHKARGISTRSESHKRGSSRANERQANRSQFNHREYEASGAARHPKGQQMAPRFQSTKRGDSRPVATQAYQSQNNRKEPAGRCWCRCRCNSKTAINTRDGSKCYGAPIRGHSPTNRQVHRSQNNRAQSEKKVASHPPRGDIKAFPEARNITNRSKASERDYSRTDEGQAQNTEVEPEVSVELKADRQTRSSEASEGAYYRTDKEVEPEVPVEQNAVQSIFNRSEASESDYFRKDEGQAQNNEVESEDSVQLNPVRKISGIFNRSEASERYYSPTDEGQAQNNEVESEDSVQLKPVRKISGIFNRSEAPHTDEGQAQYNEVESKVLVQMNIGNSRTDESQANRSPKNPDVAISYIHPEGSYFAPPNIEYLPNNLSNDTRESYRLRPEVESSEMESRISSKVCYCTRKKCPSKCPTYTQYNNSNVPEVEHKEVVVLMGVRPLRSSSLSAARNQIVSPHRHRAVVAENRGQILYDAQPSENSASFNSSNRSVEQQQQQLLWDRQQLYLSELRHFPPPQTQQSFNQGNGRKILLQDFHRTQQYDEQRQQQQLQIQPQLLQQMEPQMEPQFQPQIQPQLQQHLQPQPYQEYVQADVEPQMQYVDNWRNEPDNVEPQYLNNFETIPPEAPTVMMPQQTSREPTQFYPDSHYQYLRSTRALSEDVYQQILAKYGIRRMQDCPCPCPGQREQQQQHLTGRRIL